MQGDWNAKVGKDACGNWQGICGPFCNDDTNESGLRLLEFATFNDLVLANTFDHYKASRRWTWHCSNGQHHSQTNYILVRKRFRSGVNIARTRSFFFRNRYWKWRLADDDLPPSPEKNQQAKTRKTKVWPRKLQDSNVLETFQAKIGGKFAPLTITNNEDTDLDSMITTFKTAVTETASEILGKHRQKKTLGHCRDSWSVWQKERTEKETIWIWRIWEIQGSEQQYQEVHGKDQRKLDRRTV